MCIPFDTIPECDGRTDGQICHNHVALCMHSMLTCYENYKECQNFDKKVINRDVSTSIPNGRCEVNTKHSQKRTGIRQRTDRARFSRLYCRETERARSAGRTQQVNWCGLTAADWCG